VIIIEGEAPAKAAKAATATIPIVFGTGVASLNQLGGNLTGASYFSVALGASNLLAHRRCAPDPVGTVAIEPASDQMWLEKVDREAALSVMANGSQHSTM
jgi:hypothetical protein